MTHHTYEDQIDKGLYPHNCEECGEYFWLRPDTADRVKATPGKRLLCRNCQELHFPTVGPYPFCCRLTNAERADHEWELQNQEPAPRPAPPAAEPPTLMDDEIAELRMNLKNSIQASGTPVNRFERLANVGNGSVSKLLYGTYTRRPNRDFLVKVRAEMSRRGWVSGSPTPLSVAAEEVLEGFRRKGEAPPAPPGAARRTGGRAARRGRRAGYRPTRARPVSRGQDPHHQAARRPGPDRQAVPAPVTAFLALSALHVTTLVARTERSAARTRSAEAS